MVDGNWPASPNAVAELLNALSDLHSRFRTEKADSKLPPQSLGVELTSTTGKHTLTFYEEPGSEYRYLSPTFVRVDDDSQAMRVTPGLMSTLSRPAERYRQLQIFPSERDRPPQRRRSESIDSTPRNCLCGWTRKRL